MVKYLKHGNGDEFWKSSDGVPLRIVDSGRVFERWDPHAPETAVPVMPHEMFREMWKDLIKEAVREVLAEERRAHG